jgi:hypothetical protein
MNLQIIIRTIVNTVNSSILGNTEVQIFNTTTTGALGQPLVGIFRASVLAIWKRIAVIVVIGSATTTEARAQPLVDIVRAGILTVSHTVLIRVLVRHATATDTFLSLIWIGSTVIETVNDTITVGIIISDITTTESRA